MADFDAEELFHLGLKASEGGDKERSIMYFKRAIELEPAPASYYLLGAEYAEIGMMPRAAECIQKALDGDPELWTAWFQLGLIYLALQDTEKAQASFQALEVLGEESYLFHFALGMLLLINEEVPESLESLTYGIQINHDNPALNRDVRNIIDSINENLSDLTPQREQDLDGDPEVRAPDSRGEKESREHLLAAKYRSE